MDAFGPVSVDQLRAPEIGRWRRSLPPRSAPYIHRALRQVLAYGVRCKYLDENPAALIPNPAARRGEVQAFGSWAEVEAVAAELPPPYQAIPVFAAGTGLRPHEWIALERRDVDRERRALSVQRLYANGRVKEWGKTDRSRRRVPLRRAVLHALETAPARLDTPLLFPARRGGYLSIGNFRVRHWRPALRAAGLEYRPPYALRHTYAAFSIAAGISLFALARRMGTSVEMIDQTYGHLAPDADEWELGRLDAFDARENAEGGHILGTGD